MYLRNGRIGVLDLSTGEATDEEFSGEGTSLEVARGLISAHGSDSIVLGTGILTGSLVPAACAGIVAAAGRTNVLLGFAGLELKLSGFDFLVLKGKAPGQGYVWARDGVVDFVEMSEASRFNSWQRTDKIRSDQGDSKIQVVSGGSWCDAGVPASQLVVDYWGGEDKVAMGVEFGRRNLAAVAFRGMGELELADPEAHFEEAASLIKTHLLKLGENKGLASYYSGSLRPDFESLVHRTNACYACPFPCRTFLKTEEDPKEMRLVSKEPGYLHYDISALERAFNLGIGARDASRILARCAQAGAEPVAALNAAVAVVGKPDLSSVEAVLSNPLNVKPSGATNFEASFKDVRDFERCLGLGLCPRYWSKVGLDLNVISSLAESALGSRLV